MNRGDAHENGAPCIHCGQQNDLHAAYCDGCGMELRPRVQPFPQLDSHGARRVLLSRVLPNHELDKLWSAFEAVQGCRWFPGRIVWPDEDDAGGSLLQELPEGTILLSDAYQVGKPMTRWFALVSEIAEAVDDVQRFGSRLNSLGLNSIIVAQDTHEFVGLCLPMCLTHLDTPRGDMSLAGVDCCFAAPEIQGYVEHPAGPAADVYALAVLTYSLLAGEPPRDLVECNFCPVTEHLDLGPSLTRCLEDSLAMVPERRPRSASLFVERLRRALVQDLCRRGPELRSASLTDIGLGGRENNEDACGVWMRVVTDAHGRCLVGVAAVADGMGGGAFGERASSFCIDRILDDSARDLRILGESIASPKEWIAACGEWLLGLNQDVIDLGRQLTAPNDVGSTLTAVLFTGCRAFLLHAGDSRLYLVRSGGVSQLTRSQTYAEQLHEEGQLTREEVDVSIYRNVLTSYIGSSKCSPQVEELHLFPGDTLVLCSDGLMEGLMEAEMHDLAAKLSASEAVGEMVRRCKRRLQAAPSDLSAAEGIACSDNMTAVVVQIAESVAKQDSGTAQAEDMLSEESVSATSGASSGPPAEGETNA